MKMRMFKVGGIWYVRLGWTPIAYSMVSYDEAKSFVWKQLRRRPA
jgi:hypothetical protein